MRARVYPQMEGLIEAVKRLDRAREQGGSVRDVNVAVYETELACLSLVHSTEMVRRRDQIRANLAVERHFREQTRREGPS